MLPALLSHVARVSLLPAVANPVAAALLPVVAYVLVNRAVDIHVSVR